MHASSGGQTSGSDEPQQPALPRQDLSEAITLHHPWSQSQGSDGRASELQAHPRVSTMFKELACSLPNEGLTLRELLERLGERGLLLLSIMLTLPFLLPISIPGSSIPFGMIIALNGLGLILHRAPWLPNRLMRHRLEAKQLASLLEKGAGLFRRLERLIHPRLFLLTHGATMGRVNGALLGFSGLLLMSPLPLPLSNTLPAYAILFLAAGSLERDGYVVLAGYVMVMLTLAYFGIVAVVGGVGSQALMEYL